MDFFDRVRKREAMERLEADGEIADSMDVRMSLMARVRKGEITLETAQKELRNIKRNAAKQGKKTRNKAWINS